MAAAPLAPPEVGDHIHNFQLPGTTGEPLSADKLVGRPLVLCFCGGAHNAAAFASLARALADVHEPLKQLGVCVIGITADPVESLKQMSDEHRLPFALASDAGGRVAVAYGATDAPTTFLIGPDFRVAKIYSGSDPSVAAELLADATALLRREEPRRIVNHAPVLLIPNVLPPDFCRHLIELWETENVDSGFMKQIEGRTVGMLDYDHKIRRDHFMQHGPDEARLMRYISTRVVPQVRVAFNYTVTRKEDFRIACYDASRGGYFRPHRDNTTDGTAHRRFAMSLLLNDDYEGGYVRFPEYGPHLYRPEAGGAVIFSCSLLHEATDVTAGRRFVLLSFLYGEAEAKMREDYNRRVGGGYRA